MRLCCDQTQNQAVVTPKHLTQLIILSIDELLDYEFARAKVIEWGESAYAEERYICTQVLFAQLFPGATKSLTSMCDRLVLDSSERDDRHGALLDAEMTADALILLERQLKHGESGAPRSWTST